MIRIENLIKIYGEGDNAYQALHGVTFHVPSGRFASIMGPSGCGKSTLLNVLGLMDRPTGGAYHLDGDRVESLDDSALTVLRRRHVGFVFQSFNLLPRLSALQNICLPMSYEGVPKEVRESRGRSLLKRVGLKGKENNTPLELSGGERQRVGIARSLANRPKLLLADEPTGNLDTRTAKEVMELFKSLHADGMTILVVTHDSGIAEKTEQIIHIRDGLVERDETR